MGKCWSPSRMSWIWNGVVQDRRMSDISPAAAPAWCYLSYTVFSNFLRIVGVFSLTSRRDIGGRPSGWRAQATQFAASTPSYRSPFVNPTKQLRMDHGRDGGWTAQVKQSSEAMLRKAQLCGLTSHRSARLPVPAQFKGHHRESTSQSALLELRSHYTAAGIGNKDQGKTKVDALRRRLFSFFLSAAPKPRGTCAQELGWVVSRRNQEASRRVKLRGPKRLESARMGPGPG
ncbi:hypothetical protein C8R47DRAFT_1083139 [Mycena vitilis]|nr:hypothetical protein C8R47DRAFT_1083139 [Mycena vitilis]